MSSVLKPQSDDLLSAQSGFINLGDARFFRIADVDQLQPFFVNVVSHCDIWMYVSSRGGLSAGRVDPDGAFFPYETVDRIHDSHAHTGGYSQFWVNDGSTEYYWEPFADLRPGHRPVHRQLSKHIVGNQLVFEEFDSTTDLLFQTRWAAADELGIIKTTTLKNLSDRPQSITIFDGFQNILPCGIPRGTYQFASCLTDAYKRSEYDASAGLGIFAVTSGISDGTHPVEVMRTNVAWTIGLPNPSACLSDQAPGRFRKQQSQLSQHVTAGRRGNFYITNPEIQLAPGETLQWHLIGDVDYDHRQLTELRDTLQSNKWDSAKIESAIQTATDDLRSNIASADGLQLSADETASVHHFANVLFNNMRGGVFDRNESIQSQHFVEFVRHRNAKVAAAYAVPLSKLPETLNLADLRKFTEDSANASLKRLVCEYLPIKFSRRHGDPSRPWNQFAIRLKDTDGNPQMKFEGNWRDIFQNWEGLCVSFPGFLESVITKFVNGSTFDGFNPYRVTSDGMEWEEPEPENPWSNIGYWGDHQIIYLLKLLEALNDRQPARLRQMLGLKQYVYLDVPYRIKPYADLIANGRDTIEFDLGRAQAIAARVDAIGEDGKLLPPQSESDAGTHVQVTFAEKLLVPMLSKLSNFVVDGGIWMNTQRPEWNDANNALVGAGVSAVTLYYLRRYLAFCEQLFSETKSETEFVISPQVAEWFTQLRQTFIQHKDTVLTDGPSENSVRRKLLDEIGNAFSEYRAAVHDEGFDLSNTATLTASEIMRFCKLSGQYADDSIRSNQRDDSLYHAYNLIEFGDTDAGVKRLYEMLEGQVAVLSSGGLSPTESADLIEALFNSHIYRDDQKSFMLYPKRQLADFLDRNVVSESDVMANGLLKSLVESGDDSVIIRDAKGVYRFHGSFQNRNDVSRRLDELKNQPERKDLVDAHRSETIRLFEDTFQHDSYTGRSGTMYGYEGIGCIYWHMVSKLLLAVQENYFAAVDQSDAESGRLAKLYYQVREGLGPGKTPEVFGAFPTDPYSHTPGHAGARQPGMTGQVKEEILTRFGELGVRVRKGQLEFNPTLLRTNEFLGEPSEFIYFDVNGEQQTLPVPERAMAFTYCQIPVIYELADSSSDSEIAEPSVRVHWRTKSEPTATTLQLDRETTQSIHGRRDEIERIVVTVPASNLFQYK